VDSTESNSPLIGVAWTAGIIDADGFVSYRHPRPQIRHCWNPIVGVDSTDPEILSYLAEVNGSNNIVKKAKRADHHRQCWTWRVYGSDQVIELLSRIRPYMHCPSKAKRSDLLIERFRACTPRNGYYSPQLIEDKLALLAEFKSIGAGRGSQCRAS